jgi:hypothetical protein
MSIALGNSAIATLKLGSQQVSRVMLGSAEVWSDWSPLDLSPALWLSDTGSDASVWPDLSNNANHAVQAIPSRQPAIIANTLNGRQVRRWTATSQILIASANSPYSGGSFAVTVIAVVVRRSSTLLYSTLLGQSPGGDRNGMAFGQLQNQGGALASDCWAPTGRRTTATNLLPDGSPAILSWVCPLWSGQKTNTQIFVNGGAQAMISYGAGDTAPLIAGPLRIGNWQESRTDMQWPGDIAEMIVCSAALATDDRQKVERYLGAKYGITVA